MTKAYTLNRLINEVSALSAARIESYAALAQALSPRAGASSRKLSVLDAFLNGQTNAVLAGRGRYASLGKTARTRLVRALRARQRGSF